MDLNNKNLEWVEPNKNWEETKPGWYQHQVNLPEIITHATFVIWYADILDWIYSNVPKCERHCRWAFDNNKFCIKFRYERDYLFFTLRW